MAYPRTHNLFSSHFCGVEMRQYWADLALWELFLNEHPDIRAIMEIGTFHGGMSIFLKVQCLVRGMAFYTVDKDRPALMDTEFAEKIDLKLDFIHGDFWKDDTHQWVTKLLHLSMIKPILLFVDGGNKAKEFAAFVPHLAPGDYVGVHDYSVEFKPGDEDAVGDLIERVFWDECLAPPQPCLTRFWRRV